jgi:cysteine desulfurase
MAYLDHAATTPMRPEAVEAMLPFLSGTFGNPSGLHGVARAAKTALEEAREVVADALGCLPREVVFTGGGTEADNLALKGAAWWGREHNNTDGVVITAVEHHAVLHAADRLQREGFRVARVGVDRGGVVKLDALAEALDDRTAVVSVMLANNEVGTIQPFAEITALVRERAPRAVLHTDAVQAVAWVDVVRATAGCDLVAISGHKFGGPKGVGALVVRGKTRAVPVIDGGGQEWGLRSGTHNVAGIAALAAALRVTTERRAADVARVGALRDRLAAGIRDAIPHAFFNGDPVTKIAGNCHVGLPGLEAESLLLLLDREGVAASSGSACSSGSMDPSHVLLAMGLSRAEALSSIRLSFGWASTDDDVDAALAVLPAAVSQLRPLAARRR